MNVITLFLVFIMNGELKTIEKDFTSMEECNKAGQAIVEKQILDPHFDEGLFAACVVNKKTKV